MITFLSVVVAIVGIGLLQCNNAPFNVKAVAVTEGAAATINLAKCHDAEASLLFGGEVWDVPNSMILDLNGLGNITFRLQDNHNFTCQNSVEYDASIPKENEVQTLSSFLPGSTLSSMPSSNGGQILKQGSHGTIPETTTIIVDASNADDAEEYAFLNKVTATFTTAGYLTIGSEYFSPNEFCIKSFSNGFIRMKVCKTDCQKTPCIPLCCPIGKIIYYDGKGSRCLPSLSKYYRPIFYEDVYTKLTFEEERRVKPHYYKHLLQCKDGGVPIPYPFGLSQSQFRMLQNGKLHILHPIKRAWQETENFCLSGLFSGDLDDLSYSGDETAQILFTCGDYSTNEVVSPHFYIPVFFINSLFLFVTSMVYILLWDKQNIHGRTVLCFTSSMFFMFSLIGGYNLIGLIYASNENDTFFRSFLCPFIGILTHYFFLATFCWLTVINLDLWWTFKSMSPISTRSKGLKRFVGYLLFAWGVPAIIISVGLVLTYTYPDPLSEVKIPGYGKVNCFLESSAKGLYLYYNIGVLMGVNIIFMSLTLYTIYTFKKGTRAVDSARSSNSRSLSVKLFFKLFMVMGVTWIFDVISWWQMKEETILHFIVLDIFNLLQAVGVFFIFVCKRKILIQLEQKYPFLQIVINPLKRATMSRTATTGTMTSVSGRNQRKTFTTQSTVFSLRRLQTNNT